MSVVRKGKHVSLVAVPDVMIATVAGLYDVFNCFGALGWFDESLARHPPFDVDIVTSERGMVETASGLGLPSQRTMDEVQTTDLVIVPSMRSGIAGRSMTPGAYRRMMHIPGG